MRRRTAPVVLVLLMVLTTVLGLACPCGGAQLMQPVAAATAYDVPGDHVREHGRAAPGHDQCGTGAAVDTPTTGPGPHPQPLAVSAHVDTRPVIVMEAVTRYVAVPRAPDLHVLQVLRS
ncbi:MULTISPECIES: hypothetical protein [Streptomyces]|uniref:hypothetical protein n=1 Tax=Streptomyces TaxID=1883 RepID=UPI00345F3A40